MRFAALAAVLVLLSVCVPVGQAQDVAPPIIETRPRLVLLSLNAGLGNPPPGDRPGDPVFPPNPCVTFDGALEAVVGREGRPYLQGLITVNGAITDQVTGFTQGTVDTRGKRGSAVLSGLLAGQPSGIAPCWTVQSLLTNARTGEVLDSLTQEIDLPPVR